MEYKFSIGLKKTLKNISITYGLPAILYFLNSYNEWMPVEYANIAAPIIGGICYMLKNYNENRLN